ncbi:hypothetical protein ACFQ07_25775, partial [Actinomadura adrarensis]
MVQLTYYEPRGEACETAVWEPQPDDVHTLRHGYNLADLERLTRMSIARVYGLSIDYRTRYDTAWSAIAEALYAADARPEPNDLVLAGQKAISQYGHDEMHHRGYDTNKGGGCMPKFAAYWLDKRSQPGPEPGVVERFTLAQIWEQLPDKHRQVLHALAVCDDYRAAAGMVGKSYGAYLMAISRARAAFLELWHEGEEPSRPWGFDRRSSQGTRPGSATNFLRRRERHRQGVTQVRRRITESQLA